MSMLERYKIGLVFAAVLLIQACSTVKTMPEATSTELLPGKVVLVGKFVLNPPLGKLERNNGSGSSRGIIHLSDPSDYINKVFFSVTPQAAEKIDTSMMSKQWNNTLDATFGVTYFKQTDGGRSYLNAGMAYVDAELMDKAWLPGFMTYSPTAEAKAVYIGTVHYTRDDFWNITKVQVIDEYKSAKAEFEKRFGKSMRLEKALLRREN